MQMLKSDWLNHSYTVKQLLRLWARDNVIVKQDCVEFKIQFILCIFSYPQQSQTAMELGCRGSICESRDQLILKF